MMNEVAVVEVQLFFNIKDQSIFIDKKPISHNYDETEMLQEVPSAVKKAGHENKFFGFGMKTLRTRLAGSDSKSMLVDGVGPKFQA